MAQLEGQSIVSTYQGLLSVTGPVGTDTVEAVTDGAGTSTSLSLSQHRATITLGSGTADDFIVDGSSLVVEGDSNKVGIGITGPNGRLDIYNPTTTIDRSIQVTQSGTRTAHSYGAVLDNTSETSTTNKYKYGAYITSSGAWTATGAINYGLRVSATGGTTNYAGIFEGGKVGIGTAAPGSVLSVSAGNNPPAGSNSVVSINLGDGSTYDNGLALLHIKNSGDRGAKGYHSGSHLLRCDYSDATAFLINEDGHIGIGTALPLSTLQVSKTVNSTTFNPLEDLIIENLADELDTGGTSADARYAGIGFRTGGTATNSVKAWFGVRRGATYGRSDFVWMTDSEADVGSVEGDASEKMRLNNGGHLGIGGEPSSGKLHIIDTADTTAYSATAMDSTGALLTLENSNASAAQCLMEFLCQASSGQSQGIIGIIDAGGSNQANMVFGCRQDGGSDEIIERMRIKHNGYVGIGEDDPQCILHVVGTGNNGIRLYNGSNIIAMLEGDGDEDGQLFLKDSGANNKVHFTAHSGGNSYINNGGNLGIGTASPDPSSGGWGNALTVADASAEPAIELWFNNASVADEARIGQVNFMSGTTAKINAAISAKQNGTAEAEAHLIFHTRDSGDTGGTPDERMRIDSDGYVGIGDTVPGNKLVVKGAVADGQAENIFVVKESGGETAGVMGKSATQDGYFNLYDASGNLDIRFDAGNVSYLKGGFVGIGINPPLSPLHVYSSGETNIPIVHIEHGEGDMEAGDEILRLDASSDQDIHGTQLKIITIHDGQDGEIGKFVTASDGNINTAWTNVSDVRLKKDIKDTSMDGLAIMNSIKLRDFKWNAELGKHRENKQVIGGLIADEVYEVYRQATTGTPGAVKEDGSIDRMGVTESQFITVMMKAIQELSAKVTALENAN